MRPLPPTETRFDPGQSGNPGGAPRGKRISTWMAEFGEVPPSRWPNKKQLEKMPANASIALARVRRAATANGLRDTELVLNRTEGAVTAEPSAPMLEQIAAAIIAMKAAGVTVRAPIEAEVIPARIAEVSQEQDEQDADQEASDEQEKSKRFRRGRA